MQHVYCIVLSSKLPSTVRPHFCMQIIEDAAVHEQYSRVITPEPAMNEETEDVCALLQQCLDIRRATLPSEMHNSCRILTCSLSSACGIISNVHMMDIGCMEHQHSSVLLLLELASSCLR